MARVNMAAIKVAVAKDSGNAMRNAAKERAQQVFEDAVLGMQIEFEDHPVTREIDAGVHSPNISQTLGGGSNPKNLYSFIGFDEGDSVSPLEPIRDALDPSNSLGKVIGPRMRYAGKEVRTGNVRFKFEVAAPLKEAIYKATPMPWATGWSWAQKIETRIPGFVHFLARYMGNPPSRSHGGIQAKDGEGNLIKVREGEYQPPAQGYLTTIFKNFIAQVREYNRGGFKRRFK